MSMRKISSKVDVPEILHEPFIEYNYRVNHSIRDCLFSLFYFHNEWMNIWTHLIALLAVSIVMVDFMMDYMYENNLSTLEFITLEIFFIATAVSMLTSVTYHTFRCVSEEAHHNLLMLDLFGAGLLSVGTLVPTAVFGDYMHLYFTSIPSIYSIFTRLCCRLSLFSTN